MRLPLIVVLVVAMFSTAACGGSDDARMRATLTDEGCTYEGDTEVAAGSFQIEVRNQTQHDASFAFARLANGYTAATIKPILAKETAWELSLTANELQGLLDGKRPLQHPRPDLPQIFDHQHGGSDTSLVCRVNLLGNFLFRKQYVASRIDVTGALPGVTTT